MPSVTHFGFITDTGDVIRDIIRVENLDNNAKTESVDRYINDVLVSITITEFLNGYKHGPQFITKINRDGSRQNFTTHYIFGVTQN